VIGRQIVLIVLTAWLAMPAARLACAVSCAQPVESAPASSHCHEATATPTGEASVQAGHACPDVGSLEDAALVKDRQAAPVAIQLVEPRSGDGADNSVVVRGPLGPGPGSRPPDGLLVPLRL